MDQRYHIITLLKLMGPGNNTARQLTAAVTKGTSGIFIMVPAKAFF